MTTLHLCQLSVGKTVRMFGDRRDRADNDVILFSVRRSQYEKIFSSERLSCILGWAILQKTALRPLKTDTKRSYFLVTLSCALGILVPAPMSLAVLVL
jgi:hypothetical protein